MEWITSDPLSFVRLAVRKIGRLFSPLSVASSEQDYPLPLSGYVRAVYSAFLVLALGGLLSLRCWREMLVFYALIARVLASTVVFYGDVRYTLPMVPSLLAFASLALIALHGRLRRGSADGV